MRKSILQKLFAIAACAGLVCAVDVGISAATTITNAQASGTVVVPVEITESVPMSFGKFVAADAALLPLGLTDSYGTVTNITKIVDPKTASFTIKGTADQHYKVTLPTAVVTLNGSPSGTMDLDTFIADKTGGTFTGADDSLKVGATLHVSASQPAGVYSGTYSLTVEYD